MLGVRKSDGNSQVHCCFVSFYMVEIHLIVPPLRWKGVITNQDHMCDYFYQSLIPITFDSKFNRM